MTTMEELFDSTFPVKCTIRYCDGNCVNSINGSCSNYNPYTSTKLHLFWSMERNPDVNPYLPIPSTQMLILVCPNNSTHTFSISWEHFQLRDRCPYCSYIQVRTKVYIRKSVKSLLDIVPNIREYWDFDKNDISLEKIRPGSKKEVYFRCKVREDHVWKMQMWKFCQNTTCPFCARQRIVPKMPCKPTISIKGSAWHQKKGFMLGWDFEKNKGINPETIRCSDVKKYWFRINGLSVKLSAYDFKKE